MSVEANTYIFCKNELDAYQKAILSLSIAFAASPLFSLSEKQIAELSTFLQVDYQLLESTLSVSQETITPMTTIQFGSDHVRLCQLGGNTFFAALIRLFFAGKSLTQIGEHFDSTYIKDNIDAFFSVIHDFEMINATTATFECMYYDRFSLDYTVFDNADFCPMDLLNMLRFHLSCGERSPLNSSVISMITRILWYGLTSRLNALRLIVSSQILKHSPFFDKDIKQIASELYDHLLFILKNGRIISAQTNLLYATSTETPEKRSRADNTTRMQIIYGYPNYDAYVLRLDLAHKGEGFVHYNNKTPGGIKSCLFSECQYQEVINQYPLLEPCFIKYGHRWALKERGNFDISQEMLAIFEKIRSQKEHEPVFEGSDEAAVTEFIYLITRLLPANCFVPIDKDEQHARYCFNFDKIMCFIHLYYIARISSDNDSCDKLRDAIIDAAIRYELIFPDEKESYMSEEGICVIADLAYERVSK